MLVQICLDYSSLPDARTLELPEIRFWYNGIRSQLLARKKPPKFPKVTGRKRG